MDWILVFTTALLMALAAILIRAMFGKRVAWFIGVIGALSVLLPLVLIIVLGIMGMLKAGPGTVPDDTITAIFNYIVENLPELVISAVAGAIVGFLVTLLKKVTPKRFRKKVAKRIRIV
jgi:hypothetical protein